MACVDNESQLTANGADAGTCTTRAPVLRRSLFPFWQSFLICLSGGVLGVLFTIPLRRALVTTSDLTYPEGVAAAEVLRVGSGTRGETKDETGASCSAPSRRAGSPS